jgi:hypothetical protein
VVGCENKFVVAMVLGYLGTLWLWLADCFEAWFGGRQLATAMLGVCVYMFQLKVMCLGLCRAVNVGSDEGVESTGLRGLNRRWMFMVVFNQKFPSFRLTSKGTSQTKR